MKHCISPVILTAAALFATAAPAAAQDPVLVEEEPRPSRTAAFLRAYYLETALKDWEGAEAIYRKLTDSGVTQDKQLRARAQLGLARTLVKLGRRDEARALIDLVRKEYPDLPDLKRTDADTRLADAGDVGDLRGLVAVALTDKEPADVAQFGDRAVPFLAEELRAADPAFVKKSAETLLLIDTPAAHDALLKAVSDPRVLYPLHLFPDSGMDTRAPALEAATRSANKALRTHALEIALDTVYPTPESILQAVLDDDALRAWSLPADSEVTSAQIWARLVIVGLTSEDAAVRRDAIASLRDVRGETHNPNDRWTEALYDPPASVLDDEEALAALRHAFLTVRQSRATDRNLRPSDALVARMLESDDGVRVVADWTTEGRALPDPDAFTAGLARLPRDVYDGVKSALVAASLLRVLGEEPRPEHLARLGKGGLEREDFEQYVRALAQRGRLHDGPTFRALQSGCEKASFELKLLEALDKDLRRDYPNPVPAWLVDAYGDALRSEDAGVRLAAGKGLYRAQSHGADVSPHLEAVAALFDDPQRDASVTADRILSRAGRAGALVVLERVRADHRSLGRMVSVLHDVGDPVAVEPLKKLVLTPGMNEARSDLVVALLACAGNDDVSQTLRDGLLVEREDANETLAVLISIAPEVISEAAVRDLFLFALEQGIPEIQWSYCDTENWEDIQVAKPLVLAALGSSNSSAKRWAAGAAGKMLLREGWTELLAAAADSDPETRKAARASLRAIRDSDAELAALQATGERRAAQDRAREMLGEGTVNTRRAGIALAVAVRMPGAIDALTKIAQSDIDEDVREDARRALLTLGQMHEEPKAK